MMAVQQIEKLNRGEQVPTYELLQVNPSREPVVGELRYVVPLVPNPAEPVTPVVPDAPIAPADPDPGTPADPEQPATVPGPEEPATPVVPEPRPDES